MAGPPCLYLLIPVSATAWCCGRSGRGRCVSSGARWELASSASSDGRDGPGPACPDALGGPGGRACCDGPGGLTSAAEARRHQPLPWVEVSAVFRQAGASAPTSPIFSSHPLLLGVSGRIVPGRWGRVGVRVPAALGKSAAQIAAPLPPTRRFTPRGGSPPKRLIAASQGLTRSKGVLSLA